MLSIQYMGELFSKKYIRGFPRYIVFPIYHMDRIHPCIMASTGVQQGNPLGSLAFALAIDSAARGVGTELNVWYLDDGTLAGQMDSIVNNLGILRERLGEMGLEVNPQKCEASFLSCSPIERGSALASLESILPGIRETSRARVVFFFFYFF